MSYGGNSNMDQSAISITNALLNQVDSINSLVAEQQQANSNQRETNETLKKQCEELKKRNQLLEEDNKSQAKGLRNSLIVNVVAIFLAVGSLVTAIIAVCK